MDVELVDPSIRLEYEQRDDNVGVVDHAGLMRREDHGREPLDHLTVAVDRWRDLRNR
jgi:hypothetical protein